MNKIFIILSVLLISANIFADTYVKGHYRSNGAYVKPHYRSSPNSVKSDNWSTKGNVNPYTGKSGTKSLYNSGSSFRNNSYGTKSKSKSNSLYGGY
jgi:hypothetical protein